MKEKICVYTCITGDYDEVKEFPNLKESELDYYLFTNNRRIKSNFWNVIYIDNENLDNIRLARKIKVLGHEILNKYDVTVWLDGASFPRKKISQFINDCCDLKTYSLISFKHRERDCIYDEALECIKLKKDNKDIIKKQMNLYKSKNYPKHNGLIESTIIVRKNNDKNLKKVMKSWFEEITNFSYRDQLSFNYVVSNSKLKYNLLDKNVFDNDYFGWENHNKKKTLGSYTVHFGKNEEYDYDSLVTGEYKIKNDKYIARFKCPKDTKEFKIEFADFKGILFSDLEIVGENITSTNLVNYSKYFEYEIFDNDIPTLFIYGDFKKGQIFEISICLSVMSEDFYFDLLKRFNITLIETISSKNDNIFRKIGRKCKLIK